MTGDLTFLQALAIALAGGAFWSLVAGLARILRHGRAENAALIAKGAADATVALEKALQAERAEVADLREQLNKERLKARQRDNKIAALEEEVGQLRTKLRALESDARRMHEELSNLRTK